MKQLLAIASLCIASQFALAPAYATEEKKLTPQQQRMKDCNAEAASKALKGDERKAFMKECLSAKKDGRAAQQEKMKICNAEATKKSLKGDERKAFMSDCLKN
jgi:hypothetical protein